MSVDDVHNESLLNDILRIMDEGPPSLNSSINATIVENSPSTKADNDIRYETLLHQNILLATEIKKLWMITTDLKNSVSTLKSEKDTLEQELNDLNVDLQ